MLNKLKEQLERLQSSEVFTSWMEHHTKSYLTAGFVILQDLDNILNHDWQIDYYCPEKKEMFAFIMHRDSIELKDSDKAFQKYEKDPFKLNLNNVKISPQQAIDIVYEDNEKNNRNRQVTKIICVLQNIDDIDVYNITQITAQFSIINARINADTGDILQIKEQNILDIASFKKGKN